MGWNGSWNGNITSCNSSRNAKKTSTLKRWFYKYLVIVILPILTLSLFIFNDGDPKDESHESKKIIKAKKGKKQPVIKEVVKLPTVTKKAVTNQLPTKIGEVVNGHVMLANGRIHKVRGEMTNSTIATKAKYAIFKHYSENAIAGILSQEPGMNAIGTIKYGKNFEKSFLESLSAPIIINDDDSEDTKNLKRAVADAKKELQDAYNRGEDICKIMQEAREDIKYLARYKMQIQAQVMEYAHDENNSAEDVTDMIKAANELLSQKGIAPLNDTPFTRIKARLDSKRIK